MSVGAEEEHFVKSSGLAADGGDFDAARPGAGREADRKYYFQYSHLQETWQEA
jgi:hypothetical protein